jgi:glycosyltransferase involved in cell wall biosynthesis
MKIVYLVHQFYPEFYTGTEKFVLNLSTIMQKAGNRVKVITYSFYEDSFYDQRRGGMLCKEFLYKGIPVLAIKHKQLPDDLHHAIGNTALAEIADDLINVEQADVVHIGHTMRVGALAQALKPLGIPYILTLTDFFLACPKVNLVSSRQPLCNGPEQGEACGKLCPELQSDYIHQRLESAKNILFNARILVAPSAFVAGLFMREFPGLAVKVVHHGLSFERLKRNERTYATGDRIVFCYAGSFNPHKGTHVLVEAFRRLNPSNAVLKIYGSGPDESYVKSLTSMAATNGNIEFCGVFPESQTGEVLSNVDVVVVPSLCYENYPMTLHEALACNIPVIATKLGGMAEKIKDGFNGFLFEMGDSRHLQTVLKAIVNDPAVLNPLKRNISSMMIQGVEQEAYTYARAYRSLLNHRGSYGEAVANVSNLSRSVPSPREN